jgi:molybdate transport system substrate-binding protein
MCNLSKFALIISLMFVVVSCDNGETKLRVMAASSLTEAFNNMAEAFEEENLGVDVQLDFAGSQRLRYQLEFGAKADIFASADDLQMDSLLAADMIDGSTSYFAANTLVLIAANGGPVGTIADLALPGVKLVLAQTNVPAGAYSRQVLINISQSGKSFKSRVLSNIVSEEPNVRSVAQKVALGEVDAGIVYRTDVPAAHREGDIKVIEFSEESNVGARYPMAVLKNAHERELAEKFLVFVMSEAGQHILASHGFSSP